MSSLSNFANPKPCSREAREVLGISQMSLESFLASGEIALC